MHAAEGYAVDPPASVLERQPGAAVSVRDLSLDFRVRGHDLEVLRQLTFDVNPGSVVVILGPSGSGKTTLLRVLAGLWKPSDRRVQLAGSVTVDDGSPAQFSRTGRTEFFFQAPVLLPWLSVKGNLRLPLRLKGAEPANGELTKALRLTGLENFSSTYPSELSGGMRQRAVLARALLRQPSLLLMDEPFGSLDDMTREEMHKVLLQFLRACPATVLFVTHNIREAATLADRILVMSARPATLAHELDKLEPRGHRPRDPRELLGIEEWCRCALGKVIK